MSDSEFEETSSNGEIHYWSEDEDEYESDSDEEKKEMVELREDLFEVTDNNGYIFNKQYFFPEELLSLILSYVEPQDLVFNCRRVCKNWCNTIDSQVWKLQLDRNNFEVRKSHELRWVYHYWILSKKNVFNRDLVKNSCGEEGLQNWESYSLEKKKSQWVVENPPIGCEKFPINIDKKVLEHNSCFATSDNYKHQSIDLEKEGATPRFMDIVKPKITFTDWYCGRFDCSSTYKLDVRLINGSYDIFPHRDPDFTGLIAVFQYRKIIGGEDSAWHKVSQVFENYKKGVECIMFEQVGKDLIPRKGCNGCKVTGTSIVLSIP